MGKPDLSDYIDVAARITAFKEAFPEGSLQSEMLLLNDKAVVFKAYAYRDREDTRPGVGHASELIPGSTPYTRGSEVMVCETSAWGRAIAALGFEVKKGVASRDEIVAAQARQIFAEPEPKAAEWKDAMPKETDVYDAALGALRSIPADHAASCPRHKQAWKHKTGKTADGRDYDFWACPAPKGPDGYCKERPSRAWVEANS